MADRKTLTEREWVGTAIKNARTSKGLKQRELVELTQAAGLPWTQGILANVEIGSRDVSLTELLLVCVCLGTTPAELLYPQEETTEFLELPTGKRWNILALHALLKNKPLSGTWAAVWSLKPAKNLITPEDVLDVAAKYWTDPDAMDLVEMTGEPLDVIQGLVNSLAPQLLGDYGMPSRRKKWTARELMDILTTQWVLEHEADGENVSEYAKRAYRNSMTRRIAKMINEVKAEQ